MRNKKSNRSFLIGLLCSLLGIAFIFYVPVELEGIQNTGGENKKENQATENQNSENQTAKTSTSYRLPPVKLTAKAHQCLEAGDWVCAAEELSNMYSTTGADSNLKYYLALCYMRLGEESFTAKKYQESAGHLENAILYVNDDPQLHYLLGACYFTQSDYSRAENSFLEVVRVSPNHFAAHRQLGEIYYLTDDYEQALSFWERALVLKPDDEYVQRRLVGLKQQMKVSRGLDAEMDSIFTVRFDGNKNPSLYQDVVAVLDEMYNDIGNRLNLYPRRRITITLLTKKQFFNITDSPKWAGGLYEGHIKIPVGNYNFDILKTILRHEYVHAVIYDRMSSRCPWWLNEGIAQHYSGDEFGNGRKMELVSGLSKEKQRISLKALPGDVGEDVAKVRIAYSLALSAVRYLVEYFSEVRLQSILELMGEGRTFESALQEVTGFSFKEFENNWRESISSN